jgi:adenine-specific DNA-methyltransferase
MYPRLFLARNLLCEDGLIFISIDDHEVKNLRTICDEIFGEENLIESFVWKRRYGGGAKEKYIVSIHEHILLYARDKSSPWYFPNYRDPVGKHAESFALPQTVLIMV